MELKDTVDGMLSSDYKERFKAEYRQLQIRGSKLQAVVDGIDNGTLGFTPSCPKHLLAAQMTCMLSYLNILRERARIEEIELDWLECKGA